MRFLYRVPGLRGLSLRLQRLAFGLMHARRLGNGVRIFGWPVVAVTAGSRIEVGAGVVMISEAFFNEIGVSRPCMLRTTRPGALIRVGDGVRMSGAVLCAAERIEVGARTLLGADVTVVDSDLHPLDPDDRSAGRLAPSAPVVIGSDVFVGTGALVLKGVTIGDGAVVAARAVVTGDVAPGSIVAGVPARVVGSAAAEATGAAQ